MINKKWWLEDQFNVHMLRFQQVKFISDKTILNIYFQAGLLINVIHYKPEEEEEPLEPLRLEHFYLPLVLWLGGLGLSTLSFMVEIMVKRMKRNDRLESSRLRLIAHSEHFMFKV